MLQTIKISLRRLLGKRQNGNIILFVMVFGAISFTVIVLGISGFALSEHRAARHRQTREAAVAIAEAGINYYRWHLAHNQTDYADGTGEPGPYVRAYTNAAGQTIGHYSLNIIPPSTQLSVVTVESTGWLDSQPLTKRKIRAKIGFKSLTDYAFVANTQVWVSNNATIHGKLHSNSGIRFDGTTDSEVTSAVSTYICQPIHGQGCSGEEKPGIWGQGGPESYWKFPVTSQDFSSVTASLTDIKNQAQNGGVYLSASGKQGWKITFNANGAITAAKVKATKCYKGDDIDGTKNTWFCVDIKTLDAETSYASTSGYIFVDDTVWVEGTVNGRFTLGTATGKSIIINDDLIYAAKDGNHVLGLVASQDIIIPHDSPDDLEINAALLAQNGAAKRYYYEGDHKDLLTIYGSVISSGTWTWSWVSLGGAVVSGYNTISTTYDPYLTFNHPAGFPVQSEYTVLSWEEFK